MGRAAGTDSAATRPGRSRREAPSSKPPLTQSKSCAARHRRQVARTFPAARLDLGHCGRDCHDSLPVPLRCSPSLVSEQPTKAAAFGTLWRSKPQIRRNTNRSRPMKVRGVRGVHVGDRDRRSSGGPSALRPRSPTRAGVLPHEALHPFTGSLREEGSHEQHREKQQVSLE